MDTLALRPRRIGEILDVAIKLYVRNARVLIGAAAAVVVPLQIIVGVVLLSAYSDGRDINTGFANVGKTYTQAEANARLGASLVTLVATLIITSFTLAACVKAISNLYLDQPASIGASLRYGLRRLLPLIVLEFIFDIVVGIGLALLIIPGIWLYCLWSVRIPALVIEGKNPFRALGRSRRLIKGRWWPAAGVLLIAEIMVLLVSSVIQGLLTALALTSGHPSVLFAVVIETLSAIVTGVVLQPFTASVITILYYDLRIRREGYDIELLAEQLGLSLDDLPDVSADEGFLGPVGPEHVGLPGGPPYWPPPPGWRPGT